MITYIQGKLVEKNPTDIVIECNGIGYKILISLFTFSNLPNSENLKLYTHLQIREDAHVLYGFSTITEREIFRLLISVSGIGAGTARTLLSALNPEQIKEAIALNDVKTIQSVKGIGSKTAQRAVIELKDKIIKVYGIETNSAVLSNTNKDEALSALDTLGFSKKPSDKICDKIILQNPNASVETIIKLTLKNL